MATIKITAKQFLAILQQEVQDYILTSEDGEGGTIIIDIDAPQFSDETHTISVGSYHNLVEHIQGILTSPENKLGL